MFDHRRQPSNQMRSFLLYAPFILLILAAYQALSLPVQSISNLIECDICYNQAPCPKFGPFDCHSNFCDDCMNSLFEKNRNSACPMCRGTVARVPLQIDVLKRVREHRISDAQVDEILNRDDIVPSLRLVLNAYQGDIEQVKLLMPNVSGPNLNIAALVATEKNSTKLVKLLLTHPDIDPSFENNSLIFHAINNANVALVKHLIHHPRFDERADNFFLMAVEMNHFELIDYLIEHPKVHPNCSGSFALSTAFMNGNMQLVERLLTFPTISASDSVGFLCLVGETGNMTFLDRVLNRPNTDLSGETGTFAVEYAAREGHFAMLRRLFQKGGIDMAIHDYEAVKNAIKAGNWEITQYLIEQEGVYDNVKDFEYVKEAIEAGQLQPPQPVPRSEQPFTF